MNKNWLKENLKEFKNLINNKTFTLQYTEKGEPMNLLVDVYKAKIQSYGGLDMLKLKNVVRRDLQNKDIVGDTSSPTASMRNLEYLLVDKSKNKSRAHQLYFIGAFFQAKVKNIVFVKLDSRYADYFP